MDSFYIAYRDPLFGIIVFFLLVFIISFVNYWWSVYKNRSEEEHIQKFIQKFQIDESDDEYKVIFEDRNLSFESIILLSKSYEKIGDYEKSIGIYLYALERFKKREQKQQLLFLLGKVYLRAGFVERAREIFIGSLKISPRHESSLKYLTVTYELLKEYDKALEVLDALEELGVEVDKEKKYLFAISLSKKEIDIKKRKKSLLELCDLKSTQRVYLQFLLANGFALEYEELKEFDFYNLLDTFWYINSDEIDEKFVDNIKLIRDILAAKGIIKSEKECDLFEFEILKHLAQDGYKKAGISFEYFCSSCKNSYPFYFYRCPNCHSLESVKILPKVIKENKNEENISLL